MNSQNDVNVSAIVVELDRVVEEIEQKPPDLPGIKGANYVLLHGTGNLDPTFAGLPPTLTPPDAYTSSARLIDAT